MLKLFLVMALMFLPLSVPYGILCFAAARWGLQRKTLRFRRGVRVCLLIGLALLAVAFWRPCGRRGRRTPQTRRRPQINTRPTAETNNG